MIEKAVATQWHIRLTERR